MARAALQSDWGCDRVWSTVLDCIQRAAEGPIDALGISFPAFLDDAGRVVHIVNLPALEGVDLTARLHADVSARRVIPLPDLAAGTLAEARLGAGAGYRRVLCAALGTGANAGLAVGGAVKDVALGALGDAGHVQVEPDGPPCTCGGRGCLEAVCSGWALARAAEQAAWSSAEHMAAAALAGDARARALVGRAGVALGRALATWCAVFAPDVVVIAGSLAEIGPPLLEPAEREWRRVGVPYLVEGVELVRARFGGDAALVGAGLAARDGDGRATPRDGRATGGGAPRRG